MDLGNKMNIKDLDKYKRLMDPLLDELPISKMEEDIQSSKDPMVKRLYEALIETERMISSVREMMYFHNYGILGLYVFMDCVYADPLKHLLYLSGFPASNSKPSREWRVNKNFERRIKNV